jgi:hypothetical protein
MNKKMIAVFALLASVGITFAQQSYVSQADQGAALRVYNGGTGTLTIVVSTNGGGVLATLDGAPNIILPGASATNNIAWLSLALNAATNQSGTTTILVDNFCSLDSDPIRTNMLDGTYTAASTEWLSLPWNATNSHVLNLYVPRGAPYYERDGDEIAMSRPPVKFKVNRIIGEPNGTGNVTLKAYVNRTNLVYLKTWQRPYYELGATSSTTQDVSNTAIQLVSFNEEVEITVGSQDAIFVRAERATTSTKPSFIGITTEGAQ